MCARPDPVKPTRSNNTGKRRPRPLVRPRDWSRFAGHPVSVRGRATLAGKARRLEGELLGLRGEGEAETVALRLPGGEEVEFPLAEVEKAHLVYRWANPSPKKK